MIEAIVGGDGQALEQAVVVIAERAVLSPAEVRLQLRELIDAVVAVAAEEGYLVFDMRYPLWAQLTPEESRDVVGALARLGFQLEPREGWHAGRKPSAADLAMALGYAGLDTRNLRTLPGAADLAAMPGSIGVDARAFLVARAPELAVDQLVRLLGSRATALEALWDAWGQVRPVLFSRVAGWTSAHTPRRPEQPVLRPGRAGSGAQVDHREGLGCGQAGGRPDRRGFRARSFDELVRPSAVAAVLDEGRRLDLEAWRRCRRPPSSGPTSTGRGAATRWRARPSA